MAATGFHLQDDDSIGKPFDYSLLKRFLAYARPYRPLILLAILCFFIEIAMDLTGPMFFGAAIGAADLKNWDAFQTNGILFLASILLLGVFWFLPLWLTSIIGQKILFDLRTQLFAHLQRLPATFFDRNPVGRLMVRITNDVENLNELFSSGLVILFGDLLLIVAILVTMLVLNWKLTLVCMAVFPVLCVVIMFFRRAARALYSEMRKKIAALNSYLQENISGMQTVQVFNREERNLDRYRHLNKESRDVSNRAVLAYSLFFPSVDLLSTVSVGLLVWYAGGKILSHEITFPEFITFWYFTQKLFQPIRELSEKYNIVQAAMASSERIFKLMDTPPHEDHPEPLRTVPTQGKIEFRNVTFSYTSSHDVLHDISFTVRPGEKVGIVGLTGSGKTSLVNMLTRLYPYRLGQILVDDVDIREYERAALLRSIGVVSQDVFLFSGTVEDNIRLHNRDVTKEPIEEICRMVRAHDFLERLPDGYQTQLGERGSRLSTGQRQILSFARALILNPRVLILDEATSSVDPETESLIQHALVELIRNRTAIVIAHRLSTIQSMDRILVLHKGRLVEEGSHADLMKKGGLYSRLIRLHQHEKTDSEKVHL